MKKIGILILLLTISMTLYGCQSETEEMDEVIYNEYKASFDFFWEAANTNESSPGYGLIRDRYPNNPTLASTASVGFGLTAIPIGIEEGFITYEEGLKRTLGTLDTFLAMDHYHGFFYHFLNMNTAERAGTSEVSVIDTALLIAGALFAGEYFGGEVKEKADVLYAQVDWNWYIDPSRNMFYMGYYPEKSPQFEGHWDFYAEQLIQYVLAAGAPIEAHRMDKEVYYAFQRRTSRYGEGEPFIHSWFGSLFTHQFSHAWLDFRGIVDEEGVDWYQNSVDATIANRQYAIDQSSVFETFSENSWGMTASDGPNGYNGYYGAKPSGFTNDAHQNDGTIPPAGAIGSIVFLEEEVIDAMHYFETIEGLKGDFGYQDSYNFEDGVWIADDVIGINKGITLLMINNYKNGFVWDLFMEIDAIQNGLDYLGFEEAASDE